MPRGPVDASFLFTLGELQRLVRAYADRQASRRGGTERQRQLSGQFAIGDSADTIGAE